MAKANLAELDGLVFRGNAECLPHPVELLRWSDAGLYYIDTADDCFRLTAKGKAHSNQFPSGKGAADGPATVRAD